MILPSSARSVAAQYVTAAHALVGALDRDARGWIVDLRQNLGGDLYLMIAAAGPILGEGDLGGLVDARGVRRPWSYRRRGVFVGRKRRVSVRAIDAVRSATAPVAILTSRLTASAGEAVAVAFSGRARTRRFGEATAGVPTGLEDKTLADGALVRCSTAVFADRTGRRYHGPIDPDQPVAADWTCVGTDDDPVLRAALEWLRSGAR
jgi:C-terminal processing protease CtpA/Prc